MSTEMYFPCFDRSTCGGHRGGHLFWLIVLRPSKHLAPAKGRAFVDFVVAITARALASTGDPSSSAANRALDEVRPEAHERELTAGRAHGTSPTRIVPPGVDLL
jgi:hypothetical protein